MLLQRALPCLLSRIDRAGLVVIILYRPDLLSYIDLFPRNNIIVLGELNNIIAVSLSSKYIIVLIRLYTGINLHVLINHFAFLFRVENDIKVVGTLTELSIYLYKCIQHTTRGWTTNPSPFNNYSSNKTKNKRKKFLKRNFNKFANSCIILVATASFSCFFWG